MNQRQHSGVPRGRVLVVEDNDVNQKVAKELLLKLGADVGVAENGREALEALEQGDWDLVFMDWQMPVMDGLEATRAIRQREQQRLHPRIPIIAMTASAMPGDCHTCLAAGMDGYLKKPVRRRDLQNILKRWLPGAVSAGTTDAGSGTAWRNPESSIERQSVATLKELMGEDFTGLVESFVRESGAQMMQQQDGLRDRDMNKIRVAAHTLKSSATNMGGTAVAALARAVESAAQQGEAVAIESLLSKLEAALGDFQAFLLAETGSKWRDIASLDAG
jgi:CheY-like chemotaxis protein/HPt (histidine-containing phosphotransfer) domain-containing protein